MAHVQVRQPVFRAPGIVRRERLVRSARELLATHDLDTLSLADVATHARIPKGSAYHYYRDVMELYGQVLVRIHADMYEHLRRPLAGARPTTWTQIVAQLIRRGEQYFESDPAARQLTLSAKAPPSLKLRDRASDVRLGGLFREKISAYFVLPETRDWDEIFFRAVEIADLMFTLSVLEHGRIVPEMTTEAVRAVTGYLRSHLPEMLPTTAPPAALPRRAPKPRAGSGRRAPPRR